MITMTGPNEITNAAGGAQTPRVQTSSLLGLSPVPLPDFQRSDCCIARNRWIDLLCHDLGPTVAENLLDILSDFPVRTLLSVDPAVKAVVDRAIYRATLEEPLRFGAVLSPEGGLQQWWGRSGGDAMSLQAPFPSLRDILPYVLNVPELNMLGLDPKGPLNGAEHSTGRDYSFNELLQGILLNTDRVLRETCLSLARELSLEKREGIVSLTDDVTDGNELKE